VLTLLHLLSAVALLVWGTHIVRTGVMRVFGARLRTVLSRSVEKKPLAFCAGIGVTALVQSSNATTMLVTSFVAQDLVALTPALVIVLGADVGTALMARVLTFDLSWLSPLLIFIGVIFFLGRKQTRAGQLGRVGIGLGLILLALELIVQAVTPITQASGVQVIFASLTGDILLDALIGAVFALISYSSLAAVLLTATLTAAGIISFPVALCLVIGANLGSGLLAVLNNSAANAAARRVALGSLLFKLVGSLAILPFIYPLANLMDNLPLPKSELVIYFHVFYNLVRCLVMVPFAGVMARFCERIIRDEPELDARLKPKHLDTSALDTPALALANAARETLRMGDAMEQMLEGLKKVMHGSRMTSTCSIPPSSSIWRGCQKMSWRRRSPAAGRRSSRCRSTSSRPLILSSAWGVKSRINRWRLAGRFPSKALKSWMRYTISCSPTLSWRCQSSSPAIWPAPVVCAVTSTVSVFSTAAIPTRTLTGCTSRTCKVSRPALCIWGCWGI